MKTYEEILQELKLFTRFPDEEYDKLLQDKSKYEDQKFHDDAFLLTPIFK